MTMQAATPLVVRTVRLFVNATSNAGGGAGGNGSAAVFDPALLGGFPVTTPPPGWMDCGNVLDLRREAETVFADVLSGKPAMVKTRGRAKLTAQVGCTLTNWSKLALLLSGGSQSMNLLRRSTAGANDDSGGATETAMPVLSGSTATVLQVAAGSNVRAGDAVVVDVDYTGQTGLIGSGVAGTFVANAGSIGADVDYVRRVSLNVGRVASVATVGGASVMSVNLATPLLAGVPAAGMSLAVLEGFTDRLGGTYVAEWSALFVLDGVQGDRLLLHYPRLQTAPGNAEVTSTLAAGLETWRLRANFYAMPVVDGNDGAPVLCFRTYLPAPMRAL